MVTFKKNKCKLSEFTGICFSFPTFTFILVIDKIRLNRNMVVYHEKKINENQPNRTKSFGFCFWLIHIRIWMWETREWTEGVCLSIVGTVSSVNCTRNWIWIKFKSKLIWNLILLKWRIDILWKWFLVYTIFPNFCLIVNLFCFYSQYDQTSSEIWI